MALDLDPKAWVGDAEKTILHYIDPGTLVGAIVYLVLFLLAGSILTNLVKRSMRAAMSREDRHRLDPTAGGFLEDLAVTGIWIITLILYAHLIPSLRAFGTAVLAGASVVSVVVGLAAQNTLGNVVAGVSLLLYRPFRVGDTLQVTAPTGLETGVVENLSLGYTTLRCSRNRHVVMPNSGIANQVTVNLTEMTPQVVVEIPVTLAHSVDIERARHILLGIAAEHRDAIEPFSCPVTALTPAGITLTLQCTCANDTLVVGTRSDLLEQAAARLPRAGIVVPYPISEIILHRADGDAAVDALGPASPAASPAVFEAPAVPTPTPAPSPSPTTTPTPTPTPSPNGAQSLTDASPASSPGPA